MTKEEAIDIIKSECYIFNQLNLDRSIMVNTALDMAIKALEREPCEDAISREELLKAIDTWDKFGCDADTKLVPHQDHYILYIHYDDVIKCIKGMPSVTPQQKIGRWVDTESDEFEHHHVYQCSNCNQYELIEYPEYVSRFKYCPNCGAKMSNAESDL